MAVSQFRVRESHRRLREQAQGGGFSAPVRDQTRPVHKLSKVVVFSSDWDEKPYTKRFLKDTRTLVLYMPTWDLCEVALLSASRGVLRTPRDFEAVVARTRGSDNHVCVSVCESEARSGTGAHDRHQRRYQIIERKKRIPQEAAMAPWRSVVCLGFGSELSRFLKLKDVKGDCPGYYVPVYWPCPCYDSLAVLPGGECWLLRITRNVEQDALFGYVDAAIQRFKAVRFLYVVPEELFASYPYQKLMWGKQERNWPS
ncbi:hypothetical protein SELMODRAFT_430310 [Selaginella moellendorffii]|uniref:Uncharacterized protein n=1 Tax=Selaginella moellendorffii TaxID=88036 RepID=D8T901_SELML|nr:hypothetical protein SELMODRAFT_430310 [Selaginella moellendorffii]